MLRAPQVNLLPLAHLKKDMAPHSFQSCMHLSLLNMPHQSITCHSKLTIFIYALRLAFALIAYRRLQILYGSSAWNAAPEEEMFFAGALGANGANGLTGQTGSMGTTGEHCIFSAVCICISRNVWAAGN